MLSYILSPVGLAAFQMRTTSIWLDTGANIQELQQEELLEIRYLEEIKHDFDSSGYENLWQKNNKNWICIISENVEYNNKFNDISSTWYHVKSASVF